jgi:hypothetical protein
MLRIHTNIKVEVRDPAGKLLHRKVFKNLYTTVGLNLLRDALAGSYSAVDDGAIRYVAVGDNHTPPVVTDATLGNELFRKAVTDVNVIDGECETIVYLAPDDAVGTIEEIGWFCGPAATATPDTGSLLARVLYSHTKTNLESIKITRTDTIEEAP